MKKNRISLTGAILVFAILYFAVHCIVSGGMYILLGVILGIAAGSVIFSGR